MHHPNDIVVWTNAGIFRLAIGRLFDFNKVVLFQIAFRKRCQLINVVGLAAQVRYVQDQQQDKSCPHISKHYISFKRLNNWINSHNSVNTLQPSRQLISSSALPPSPIVGIFPGVFKIVNNVMIMSHSSQFSEMGDSEEDDEEGCPVYFWSGSLLNKLRQILIAQQCKFLSFTLDSLIQFLAQVYKKLRKISRRVSLLIIFLIRLLLYFFLSNNVLQVLMASRMSFLSNMLTFSDFRKEMKALQKFLEMFLVFLNWSSSPSLVSLLLLIFLKIQTFLPSVLAFVSFLSLSLVDVASLGSLGSCSG